MAGLDLCCICVGDISISQYLPDRAGMGLDLKHKDNSGLHWLVLLD